MSAVHPVGRTAVFSHGAPARGGGGGCCSWKWSDLLLVLVGTRQAVLTPLSVLHVTRIGDGLLGVLAAVVGQGLPGLLPWHCRDTGGTAPSVSPRVCTGDKDSSVCLPSCQGLS